MAPPMTQEEIDRIWDLVMPGEAVGLAAVTALTREAFTRVDQ